MRHRTHFVLRGLDTPTHPRRYRRNRSGNRLRPPCCQCVGVAAQRKWCGPAQRWTNAAVLDLGLAHLLTLVPTVPDRHRRALAARMATQLDLRLSYPQMPAAGRLPELRCAATLPPTHLHDPRVGPMCSTDPRPRRAAAALRRRPDPRSASRSPLSLSMARTQRLINALLAGRPRRLRVYGAHQPRPHEMLMDVKTLARTSSHFSAAPRT